MVDERDTQITAKDKEIDNMEKETKNLLKVITYQTEGIAASSGILVEFRLCKAILIRKTFPFKMAEKSHKKALNLQNPHIGVIKLMTKKTPISGFNCTYLSN